MTREQIITAVKGGMSYGEVAELAGCTRSAIAGLCFRAGVKVGSRPMPHSARWKIAAAVRKRWEEQRPRSGAMEQGRKGCANA